MNIIPLADRRRVRQIELTWMDERRRRARRTRFWELTLGLIGAVLWFTSAWLLAWLLFSY